MDEALRDRDAKYSENTKNLRIHYGTIIDTLNNRAIELEQKLKNMTEDRDNTRNSLNLTTETLNKKRTDYDATLKELQQVTQQLRALEKLQASWNEIKSPSNAWKRLINKSTTPPANENIYNNPSLNIQGIGL